MVDILAYILKTCDPDGIDLYFTSKRAKVTTAMKTRDMLRCLKSTVPIGRCNMEDRLGSTLEDYLAKPDQIGFSRFPWSSSLGAKLPRRLSLYVLTDAVWQPSNKPSKTINPLLEHPKQQDLRWNHVGIQFIRFGEDPEGTRRLQQLDRMLSREKLDIVDTEPANGNVWKMLLGAINHWFDGDDDDDGDDNDESLYDSNSSCSVPISWHDGSSTQGFTTNLAGPIRLDPFPKRWNSGRREAHSLSIRLKSRSPSLFETG